MWSGAEFHTGHAQVGSWWGLVLEALQAALLAVALSYVSSVNPDVPHVHNHSRTFLPHPSLRCSVAASMTWQPRRQPQVVPEQLQKHERAAVAASSWSRT